MYLTDLVKPEHLTKALRTPVSDDECAARYKRIQCLIDVFHNLKIVEDIPTLAACLNVLDEAIEIATQNDKRV